LKSKHRWLIFNLYFQITFTLNLVLLVPFIVLKIWIRHIMNLWMRRRYLTSLRLIANLIVTNYILVQWIYHAYWVILLIFIKYNISLFFLGMASWFYLKYLFLQIILRIFPSSGHYNFFLLYFYLRLNFHLWV
jgi:hypothetical protein